MRLHYKIILIIAIIVISFIIFAIFVLYNFPYNTLIKRISLIIEQNYGIGVEVSEARYVFPNKILIKNSLIKVPARSTSVRIPEIDITVKFFGISRIKGINILCRGTSINSDILNTSLGNLHMAVLLDIRNLKKGGLRNIERLNILLDKSRLKRIALSGLQVKDVLLNGVNIELVKRENRYTFSKGFLKSNLINATLNGYLSDDNIKISVDFIPVKNIYLNYPDLKPVLSQFMGSKGGSLEIVGSIKSPKINFIRR